ncbi:MAG: redoxin domain-containing protein [Desulfobacterales bacterium]|nr:MAG: redoxin domain-containing protein [Desulfobacterales bacterium]
MQEQISEIEKLNAKVIAIATKGDQDDVEKTKSSLGITFTLIPTPNRKVAQDFGVEYNYSGAAFGTIIIDNKGSIRFKSLDEAYSRTSTSRIIKELQVIQ